MIRNLKERITAYLDAVVARYSTNLPFGGKYLRLVRDVVEKNADKMIVILEHAAKDGGNFDQAVDFVINFVRGNVKLPLPLFWLQPVQELFLRSIANYLKANKGLFLAKVIAEGTPEIHPDFQI